MHFGLGDADFVDSLFVRWPDDSVLAWFRLAADRFLEVTEGDDPPVGAPDVVAPITTLAPPFPNPFNPRTTLSFTLAHSGLARLPSGAYLTRLSALGTVDVRTLLVAK